MLIANKTQQSLLLEVGTLDLAISRVQNELHEAERSSEVDHLRSQLLEAAEQLLQAHSKQENLQLEIKKVASDLELVEKRIIHDAERSKQVANDRELKAIEHELQSLRSRKSILEDAELELMESLEEAEKQVTSATQHRASLNVSLEEALSKVHGVTLTLSAQLSELTNKRNSAFGKLEPELAAVYERKAQRGIAISQTLGRDCSACRLAINGVEFESLMAEPADHVPTCPNCDALIIR